MYSINVLLADNQEMFRTGVARTLALQEDIRVIGKVGDAEELLSRITTFRHVVIMLATTLLGGDLSELIRSINKNSCKLIAVAEATEPLRFYAKQNVDGVIFRDISSISLIKCIRLVSAGKTYYQDRPENSFRDEEHAVDESMLNLLNKKELTVISLIGRGYTNKDIADALHTSVQVVKNCLRVVYDKIGVSSRLELGIFISHHHAIVDTLNEGRKGLPVRSRTTRRRTYEAKRSN